MDTGTPLFSFENESPMLIKEFVCRQTAGEDHVENAVEAIARPGGELQYVPVYEI
jgi:hypothetical protein